MKTPKAFFRLILIAAILSAIYGWFYISYPFGSWRYRMTIVVDTPEGERKGSVVREVVAHTEPRIIPEQGGAYAHILQGEAIAIDLGKRGLLFGLMRGGNYDYEYPTHILLDAFPPPGAQNKYTPEAIRYYRSLKNSKTTLHTSYPIFVKFSNLADPLSIELIATSPDQAKEYARYYKSGKISTINKAFGEGVKIKEMTIEVTDEPVSLEIDKTLNWLKGLNGSYLDGKHSSTGAAFGLDTGSFQRGTRQ
jgi:hypothetical protein